MVSSNTTSSQELNSSALLAWGIMRQGPHDDVQPLCRSAVEMDKKCASLGALKPQDIGEFTFMDDDLMIDYCLFKVTDVTETMAHTCHLQSSPQILIGIILFSALALWKAPQLIYYSCRLL